MPTEAVLKRKNFLERLVRVAEEDNEKFLLKLRDRIDRVGVDLPTIEVRFEHLSVEAEAHVGSRALPSFLNFNISIVELHNESGFSNSSVQPCKGTSLKIIRSKLLD